MAKTRRSQYVVHRGLQGRFTRVVLGLSLLYLLGYVFVVLTMKRQLAWALEQMLYACHSINPQILAQLEVLDRALLAQLVSMGTGLLVLVVIFTVLITHRVAGPLVRILAALRALPRSGAVPPLRLRKGDELGELATEVNRVAEQLHVDGRDDLERLDALAALLGELPEGSRGRAEQLVDELRTSRRRHLAE